MKAGGAAGGVAEGAATLPLPFFATNPAQDGFHPCCQFARAEGFQHVIIGADFQPDHAVDFVGTGGQEDHRYIGKTAQRAAQVEAVAVRQADIEDRQVETAGAQQRQTFGSQRDVAAIQIFPRQGEDDVFGDGSVVFDKKNGGGHSILLRRYARGMSLSERFVDLVPQRKRPLS